MANGGEKGNTTSPVVYRLEKGWTVNSSCGQSCGYGGASCGGMSTVTPKNFKNFELDKI
jgi:hypothetical protein